MQTVVIERVDERTHDVGLADQLPERARAPLTCQNLIAHTLIKSSVCSPSLAQLRVSLNPSPTIPGRALRRRNHTLSVVAKTPARPSEIGWRLRPATPRHPGGLLRLLPSGPDRVHRNPSSRGPAFAAIIDAR